MLTELLMAAMICIESGGNPNAIGKYGERGILQIRPAVIADVNRVYGTNYVFPRDAVNPVTAREITHKYINHYAKLYERKYKKKPTNKSLLAMWNGGPDGYLKKNARRYADRVLEKHRYLSSKNKQK